LSKEQQTLWGGFVAVETQDSPLEFIKVWEEVVSDGDQFSMQMDNAAYNSEKGCLTVIDNDKNQALTVYFTQHPDAKYQSTPEGVRLARAVQRCLQETLLDEDILCHAIKSNDMKLTITHTGSKGRLWTVALC
jgi:hypothetical protein